MVAKSIVAPLDRIKIMFQVTSSEFRLRNLPRVIATIIEEEGVSRLWKGNAATMVRVFPYAGVQFMVYDGLKRFFSERSPTHKMSPSESLLSGSMAGLLSSVVTYPLDLTRARLAVIKSDKVPLKGGTVPSPANAQSATGRPPLPRGFVGTLRLIYVEQGVFGLYRGLTPTLLGMVPYAGIAFTLNDFLKQRIRSLAGREVTTFEKLQCGGISGLLAQSLTYPLDVCRRRMQTEGLVNNKATLESLVKDAEGAGVQGAQSGRGVGMLETMVQVFSEQGVRGLYKGLTMNWIKGPIAFSVSFTVFDQIKAGLDALTESAAVDAADTFATAATTIRAPNNVEALHVQAHKSAVTTFVGELEAAGGEENKEKETETERRRRASSNVQKRNSGHLTHHTTEHIDDPIVHEE